MSGNSKVNEVTRVLLGERLKFTVRLHLPGQDGGDHEVIEWQADNRPSIKFFEEDRSLWLFQGDYESRPVMKWPEGAILLSEENPKP
jgi:hypothetical protein